MAVAFGSAGTFLTYAARTNSAIAVPSGVAANDIVLLYLYRDTTDPGTVTPPTGFTQLTFSPAPSLSSPYMVAAVYWKRASGADTGSYTFTHASTSTQGIALRFTGGKVSGTPVEVLGSAVNAASSATAPAVSGTTSSANEMLVYNPFVYASSTWTTPTGFTDAYNGNGQYNGYKIQASAGSTGSITATSATAQSMIVDLIGIIPETGSAGSLALAGSGSLNMSGVSHSLQLTGSGQIALSAPAATGVVNSWTGTQWKSVGVSTWTGSAWKLGSVSALNTPRTIVHGMYGGPGGSSVIDAYMSSSMNTVQLAQDMSDSTSWQTLTSAANLDAWNTWCSVSAERRLVYSIGLLTATDDAGLTLNQKYTNLCAGLYDTYFRAIGGIFASYPNLADATIRIAPRVNETGHAWSLPPGDPDTLFLYQYAYNRIAAILREACPGLTFEWAAVLGQGWTQRTLADLYPGDGFVDYIGLALTDSSPVNGDTTANRFIWLQTATNGLNDQVSLALARGKSPTLSWGLAQSAPVNGLYGGGDDAAFVTLMINWMVNDGYAYSIYNNTNLIGGIDSRLSSYSASLTQYNSLWAGGLNQTVLMTSPTLTTSPTLMTRG